MLFNLTHSRHTRGRYDIVTALIVLLVPEQRKWQKLNKESDKKLTATPRTNEKKEAFVAMSIILRYFDYELISNCHVVSVVEYVPKCNFKSIRIMVLRSDARVLCEKQCDMTKIEKLTRNEQYFDFPVI